MNRSILFILMTVLSLNLAAQQLSYQPGSGLHFFSEKEGWRLRLLGYVQSTYTHHGEGQNDQIQSAFFIRRARVDIIFDYLQRYQLFFEFDGRGRRTELVLGQLDIVYRENHKIRIGKFITPFSPENTRSSRGLSTVERYSGLNSMFLLPALDTQYGIMLMGKIMKSRYFFSITNGNGKASDNIRENNDAKDLQLHIDHWFTPNLMFGGSFNYSEELPQNLGLFDHSFVPFNSASIGGKRTGYLLNFQIQKNRLLFRGEGFLYRFHDSLSPTQQIERFLGSYLELGYFLFGDYISGFQWINRHELAGYDNVHPSLKGPQTLHSLITGFNWYRDNVFRLQLNLVYELADVESTIEEGRYFGKKTGFLILSMLQLRF